MEAMITVLKTVGMHVAAIVIASFIIYWALSLKVSGGCSCKGGAAKPDLNVADTW